MKRLLKSSKFWQAVAGTVAAIVTFHFTQDEGITLAVIGLYGVAIGGVAMEDTFGSKTVGNRPDDRE